MSRSSDTSSRPVSIVGPKLTLVTKMLGCSSMSDDQSAIQHGDGKTNACSSGQTKYAYLVSSEGIEIRQPQMDDLGSGVDKTSSQRGSPSSITSSKTDGSDIEVSPLLFCCDPIPFAEADDEEVVPSSFGGRVRSVAISATGQSIDLCSLVGTPTSRSNGRNIEELSLADEGIRSKGLGSWSRYGYPPVNPDYDVVKELGFGGEGHCSLVSRRRDKHLFALKQVKGPELLHSRPVEVLVQAMFEDRHENIIRLHHFESFTESPLVRFYFEYCAAGDLHNLMNEYREINSYIPELFIWRTFVQLTGALEFLHRGFDRNVKNRAGVVHRDIKPENIFIRHPANENAHPTVVLGDFGLATFLFATYENVGTDLWQPPEAPRKTPRGDVWALGAVIHTMLHLKGPTVEVFEGDPSIGVKKRKLVTQVIQDVPEYYSSELNELMLMACEPEQSKRANSGRLLKALTDFVTEYVPQFHEPYVKAEMGLSNNLTSEGSPDSDHFDKRAREGKNLARGDGGMASDSPLHDQIEFMDSLEIELEKLKEVTPPTPFQISSVL